MVKFVYKLCVLFVCMCILTDAQAADTCTITTQNPSGYVDPSTNNACTSGNTTKYYVMVGTTLHDVINVCSSCVSGANLVSVSNSTNSAMFAVCSNASSLASGLKTCYYPGSSCDSSTCKGTNSETNETTHQTIKTTKSCQNNTCVTTTSYECFSGYYTTDGSKTCTKCPTIGKNNVSAYTPAPTVPITGCFINPYTSIEDDKGTYSFSSMCFYSN